MYDIRCPKCNRKIAESGRRALGDFTYTKLCKCGKELKGEISIDITDDRIVASLQCDCGYKKNKTIGHVISIRCKRCKTIVRF